MPGSIKVSPTLTLDLTPDYVQNSAMKKFKKEYFEKIAINPEELDGYIDFEKLFDNSNPVEIEIGSGKGTFLVNQAKSFAGKNFLGIEWANKYYKHAVDRIGRWALENVKMLRTDATTFLPEHISPDSISGYHIYFPDPWPKKRHHKRRFICKNNIEVMLRTLKTGGIINIATDHADYFDWMKEHIATFTGRVKEVDYIRTAGADDGEMAGTNFERKYLKQGRNVYTIAIKKL